MASKVREWRAWTDEEYGLIEDHPDWTIRQLAEELDRTPNTVGIKRRELRKGVYRQAAVWSEDDDAFIVKTPDLTAAQVAKVLGRTPHAVDHRRSTLGAKAQYKGFLGRRHVGGGVPNRDPQRVGARPLLARTCPKCGLLLAAKWFYLEGTHRKSGGENWSSQCRKCRNSGWNAQHHPSTDGNRAAATRSFKAKQALTIPLAENAGNPYTAEDHVLLRDPDLTNFEKAVALKRTYAAVMAAVQVNGYKSRKGLGNAETDQWFIGVV